MLEDARGAAVRFTLLIVEGTRPAQRGAAFVREELSRVGVAVDVVALEFGAFIERLVGGDYDALYYRVQTTDPDPAVNLDFWLSSGSAHVWNIEEPSPATEWERQIDDLMRRQARTTDETERKKIFDEVQRIFVEHEPVIYFAAPRAVPGHDTPRRPHRRRRCCGRSCCGTPRRSACVTRPRPPTERAALPHAAAGLRPLPGLRRLVRQSLSHAPRARRLCDRRARLRREPGNRGAHPRALRAGSTGADAVRASGLGGPSGWISARRCSTGVRSASWWDRARQHGGARLHCARAGHPRRAAARRRHGQRAPCHGPGRSSPRSRIVALSLPPLLTSLALVFVAARTGWLPIGGMTTADLSGAGWTAWLTDLPRTCRCPRSRSRCRLPR